jgi:tetratricopeptide (TPR) repeat protein
MADRNLGILLYRTHRLSEAEGSLQTALAIYRRELPDSHPRIAEALMGLGQVLVARGQAARGDSLLRKALAIREAKLGVDDLRTAETRHALGLALVAQGRRKEAQALVVAACRTFEQSPWARRQARNCRTEPANAASP